MLDGFAAALCSLNMQNFPLASVFVRSQRLCERNSFELVGHRSADVRGFKKETIERNRTEGKENNVEP